MRSNLARGAYEKSMKLHAARTTLHDIGHILRGTLTSWQHHGCGRLGAALAYYTVFSLAPILVIAMALAGLFFDSARAQDSLVHQLTGLVGPVGGEAVAELLAHSGAQSGGVIATIIGVATVLFGATSVFLQLQSALNIIWDAKAPEALPWVSFVRLRLVSLGLVMGIGFLLLVSLVLSALLSAAGARMATVATLPPWVWEALNSGVSMVVLTGLFAALYKVLPDVRIAWPDVIVGAFTTACLFSLGKVAIGLYLGHSTIASTFGAAGSFAVLLVWIYYSAQLVLFGAEFTQVWTNHRGSRRSRPGGRPRAGLEAQQP